MGRRCQQERVRKTSTNVRGLARMRVLHPPACSQSCMKPSKEREGEFITTTSKRGRVGSRLSRRIFDRMIPQTAGVQPGLGATKRLLLQLHRAWRKAKDWRMDQG
jgi:hypothetical protein